MHTAAQEEPDGHRKIQPVCSHNYTRQWSAGANAMNKPFFSVPQLSVDVGSQWTRVRYLINGRHIWKTRLVSLMKTFYKEKRQYISTKSSGWFALPKQYTKYRQLFHTSNIGKKIECSGNSRWWHQGDIAKTIRKVKAVSSWIPQIGIRYNLLCHTLYLTILQFPDLFRENCTKQDLKLHMFKIL